MVRDGGRRRLEPIDAGRLALATDVQISPDGERILYAVKHPNIAEDRFWSAIYCATFDGRERWQVTAGACTDSTPRWSPDGSRFAFLSDRDETLATLEGGAAHNLYVFDFRSGSEARQATHFIDDVSIELTYPRVAEAFAWAPDGGSICFSAKDPSDPRTALDQSGKAYTYTRLRYKSGEYGWWDGRRRHLWLIHLATGELQRLTDGDWDAWGPVFSPSGRFVAFTSSRTFATDHVNTLPDSNPYAGKDVWLLELESGTLRKLTESDGPNMTPSFSPDGESIAYYGHRNGAVGWAQNIHLWVRPVHGDGEPINVLAGWDYTAGSHVLGDVHDVFAPPAARWSPDGETLYFLGTVRGSANLFRASLRGGKVAPITQGDHEVQAVSLAKEADRFAALVSDGRAPADLYVGRTSLGRLSRLAALNSELFAEIEPVGVRRQTFELPSRTIDAIVVTPPQYDRRIPYPAIIHLYPSFVHGRSFNFEHHLLASRGFIVVCPNPLGAASYGEEFLSGSFVRGRWFADGPEIVELVERLIADGMIDPSRVGVTGDGYGAMLTYWLITHTDLFAASCARRGVARLWPPSGDRFTGIADDQRDIYRHAAEHLKDAPLTQVDRVTGPHMTIQALGDTRGSHEAGEEFFIGLKALGRAAELVLFRNSHHFQARTSPPGDRIAFFTCVADWFVRSLHRVPNGAAARELSASST